MYQHDKDLAILINGLSHFHIQKLTTKMADFGYRDKLLLHHTTPL